MKNCKHLNWSGSKGEKTRCDGCGITTSELLAKEKELSQQLKKRST